MQEFYNNSICLHAFVFSSPEECFSHSSVDEGNPDDTLLLLLKTRSTNKDVGDMEMIKRVRYFSKKFVSVVITGLINYDKEAGGESPGKQGTNADLLADVASTILGATTRCTQLALSTPVATDLANATSTMLAGLLRRVTTGIGGEEHRKKSRKVAKAFSRFDYDREFQRELCKAAIYIYNLFKKELGQDFESEGETKRFLNLCVLEATDRIFDFVGSTTFKEKHSIVHLCIEGLWKGKSKSLSKTLSFRNKEYQILFARLTEKYPLPENLETPIGDLRVECLSKKLIPESEELSCVTSEVKEIVRQALKLLEELAKKVQLR